MAVSYELSIDEVETLLAFIKMHEPWEIAGDMHDWLEDEL